MAGIGIAKKGLGLIGKKKMKKLLKKHKGQHVYIPITESHGSIGFGKKAVDEAKAFAKKRQQDADALNKELGLDKGKK